MTDNVGRRSLRRWPLIVLGGVGAAFLVWLWIQAPALYASTPTEDGRAQAIAVTRAGILGVIAAAVAFGGVMLTVIETRKANEQTRRRDALTHEREMAEQRSSRYTAAITQLGSDAVNIRLGGIYALERLAQDSPADQPTVVEVLSAFVRNRSIDPELRKAPPAGEDGTTPPVRPAADIRAAVQVLARLPVLDGVPRADLMGADLTGPASLAGLQFPVSASLEGVDLGHADLSEARMSGMNLAGIRGSGRADGYPQFAAALLDGATLAGAQLAGVQFDGTNLTRAILIRADLSMSSFNGDMTGADLTGAHLWRAGLAADLKDAILTDANLSEANLDRSFNLTTEQVREARGDSGTTLPDGIPMPADWPINGRHPR
ncbi:pentapeptide repeat-containing protein [Parafrankia sp. CH37]|nr:pentapeptide repeat-containing protein [Parafrankia sp. CH37]MBE3202428.1 pentapeptide repeat-containing protein [Parafrankia sp. CH37]